MSLTIRRAVAGDTGQVLELIRQFADYQGLSHEVKAGEEDLLASLFSGEPRAFCDIAEWDGRPAGLAIWFYTYSTFLGRYGIYLEDLFVGGPFRGHGIGKSLLAQLAHRCIREKLGRLEWSVHNWNEPAIAFYRSQGATLSRDTIHCRLTAADFEILAAGGDEASGSL